MGSKTRNLSYSMGAKSAKKKRKKEKEEKRQFISSFETGTRI
jgi:hypothetical protein